MRPRYVFAGSRRYRVWESTHTTEIFGTVGEAETALAYDSLNLWDAMETARALVDRVGSAGEEWLERAWIEGIVVALERCCNADGELLPREVREARLADFPFEMQIACEQHLRALPHEDGSAALRINYWMVRIERAQRTGSPEYDPRYILDEDAA
jgi:hypothetical protein